MGDTISSRHEFLRWPLAETVCDLSNEPDIFYARRFGAECSDLDLDYRMERPKLITHLLTACIRNVQGKPYPSSEILNWSLKRRLQALLAIGVVTHGRKMALQASCSDRVCAEVLELAVDLLEFCESEDETAIICHPSDDTVLKLRLPTSADQSLWLNQNHHESNDVLFAGLATALVISVNGEAVQQDWQVPPAWVNSIAQSLEAHDALMTMQINSECPACGGKVALEFDLEAQLLSVLASEQRALLQHIHRLASAYHWTEAEILSLPAKRRQYYLDRLEEDALA